MGRAIDGIVAFNYRGQQGFNGVVVGVVFLRERPRSVDAVWAIFSAHACCDQKHLHVAGAPDGPCEFPIGL